MEKENKIQLQLMEIGSLTYLMPCRVHGNIYFLSRTGTKKLNDVSDRGKTLIDVAWEHKSHYTSFIGGYLWQSSHVL